VNFNCILHAIHDNVICPKESNDIKMIARPSEIKDTVIAFDEIIQPEWSSIFIH
jgi:hypothetical protein